MVPPCDVDIFPCEKGSATFCPCGRPYSLLREGRAFRICVRRGQAACVEGVQRRAPCVSDHPTPCETQALRVAALPYNTTPSTLQPRCTAPPLHVAPSLYSTTPITLQPCHTAQPPSRRTLVTTYDHNRHHSRLLRTYRFTTLASHPAPDDSLRLSQHEVYLLRALSLSYRHNTRRHPRSPLQSESRHELLHRPERRPQRASR